MLAGTGIAGWWQLEAWRHEQADDAAQRADRDPVPLADVLGPDDPFANEDDGVPVQVEGRYAPTAQQFLVSGRVQDDRTGYWLLSPLLVDGTAPVAALLVVRGWHRRRRDAAGRSPPGDVTETGVLAPGEQGSADVAADRVVEAVRIPALVNVVDTDLYSAFLVRTGGSPGPGLEPVTPPAPTRAGRRDCATWRTRCSGGCSGPSRCSCGGGSATDERSVASAGECSAAEVPGHRVDRRHLRRLRRGRLDRQACSPTPTPRGRPSATTRPRCRRCTGSCTCCC